MREQPLRFQPPSEQEWRSGAYFSKCRQYRYVLWRMWASHKPIVMFIGLNPSTADERTDDPTLRRCIGFAKDWGFGGLLMTNLFAYRSTSPEVLQAVDDPVGPDNDAYLLGASNTASLIVAAWGVGGTLAGRDAELKALVPELHCLSLTKNGQPGHPLYLKSSLTPQPFSALSANSAVKGTRSD